MWPCFQMPSAIQQTRADVEQLRREASLKRIAVSQAVEDIKVKEEEKEEEKTHGHFPLIVRFTRAIGK